MRSWTRVVCVVAAVAGPAWLGAAEPEAEAGIARIEEQRFAAMLSADVATLDRLLASDLTYVHSSAKLDTKEDFIGAIKAGSLKYKVITPEDVHVRLYDSTAVVTGRCRFEVQSAGAELKLQVRYTDVYVKRAGAWQLVAWESTRIPEP
jgi:hypothetical protein